MTATRRLGRDAILVSGGSIASVGLSAFASIIIARELGTHGRGISATVLALGVLSGTICALGLPIATSYAAGRADPTARPQLVRAALLVSLRLAVAAAVFYAVALLVARPQGGAAVLVTGAVVGAALVTQTVVQQAVLTAATLTAYAVLQVLSAVLVLVTVAALALIDELTVEAVVICSAAGAIVTSLVGLACLRRAGALARPRDAAPAWQTMRPFVSYALAVFAITSMTQIVQRLDVVIVNGFKGATQAGLYSVAVQIGDLLLVVPAALGALVFRRGARDEGTQWADLRQTLIATFALSLLGAAAVAVLAHPVLKLVFGDQYTDSTKALLPLLPGVVLLGVQSVLSSYLAARGRPRLVLIAWITTAVVSTVADLIVVPHYGIAGAGWVSTGSYALVLGMHVQALRTVRADEQGSSSLGADGD